tara:strand:- start:2386 stop:3291 length:906 start_codon:yes stop_codon:yes gene_type:complete
MTARLPFLILIFLGLLWGGATNIARFVGLSGVPPMAYAFWTVLVAAVLLTLINVVRRGRIPLSPRRLVYFLIAGALSSALPTANMFLCLNYISVGAMSFVLITIPLITYLLSVLSSLETLDMKRAAGIALGFIGTLVVILPANSLPSNQPVGWFLLAFLTPVGYAAGSVFTAKFNPLDVDPLIGANGMMCIAALLLYAATILSGQWHPIWAELNGVNALVILHGVMAALGYTLFFLLVRIAGPVYFSQSAYLVTFFGIGIAFLIYNEQYSTWLWLALGITTSGVWLVNNTQLLITGTGLKT